MLEVVHYKHVVMRGMTGLTVTEATFTNLLTRCEKLLEFYKRRLDDMYDEKVDATFERF